MDFKIDYESLCRKVWKAKDWPQLVFYQPKREYFMKGSKYDQVVSVGNSNPEILLPFAIHNNELHVPGQKYLISFIRKNESVPWLHQMELIGPKGDKIFFEELMYGEQREDFYKIKVPFWHTVNYTVISSGESGQQIP